MSSPAMCCSAGNSTSLIMDNIKSGKRFLRKSDKWTNKEQFVGIMDFLPSFSNAKIEDSVIDIESSVANMPSVAVNTSPSITHTNSIAATNNHVVAPTRSVIADTQPVIASKAKQSSTQKAQTNDCKSTQIQNNIESNLHSLDHFAANTAYNDGATDSINNIPRELHTRTNAILYAALMQLNDLILTLKDLDATFGIVIGTTTTGAEENYNEINSLDLQSTLYMKERSTLCNPASFITCLYNLNALNFGVSSACTSGAKAIIDGARLIESNLCDVVICGGVDSINTLTINGFNSLEILSSKECMPFSDNRDGINIGEGAGIFLLISEDMRNKLSQKDKFRFIVELKGYASNNDAYHITNPKNDTSALESMCKEMLEKAGLESSRIDYINLHGTGTKSNDSMESRFINAIFKDTKCSSIKAAIGHTLGASGAIEAGICAALIYESVYTDNAVLLPPNIDDIESNDNLSLRGEAETCSTIGANPDLQIHNKTTNNIINKDYPLNNISLVKMGDKKRVRHAISTSFAFGGDNSLLLLSSALENIESKPCNLLPHSGDMLLIDSVLEYSMEHIVTRTHIKSDNAFLREIDSSNTNTLSLRGSEATKAIYEATTKIDLTTKQTNNSNKQIDCFAANTAHNDKWNNRNHDTHNQKECNTNNNIKFHTFQTMEIMAQSLGCLRGLLAKQEASRLGFVLSVRDFNILTAFVDIDSILYTHAALSLSDVDGFCIYKCEVYLQNSDLSKSLIASANISVLNPTNEFLDNLTQD